MEAENMQNLIPSTATEESMLAAEIAASANGKVAEEEIITPKVLNLDYRYVRLLGEGANGRTWLAKDRRTGVDVAIKELKFADDLKSMELFEREAQVLKSINVNGVPKCFKNLADDGISYIIQEYIPYPSLDDMLDKGKKFSEEEVYKILELVSAILFALQTQYVPAIVHRDIKPGNILYRPSTQGKEARAWLIDFGAVDKAHKQTSGSTIAGTFGYMAPEQLQGEVSVKSDYYALGATALHLLTGVFPYEIPSELFQLNFHPVIAEKAPDTTKPMIELLDLMLASKPEERPIDIVALRDAIFRASESSKKYREINRSLTYVEEEEVETNNKFVILYRKTIGKWRKALRLKKHQKELARRIRELEERERREKEEREKREAMLRQQSERNGIDCDAVVRRVSVARVGGHDENILEAIFSYQGNWYPAFVIVKKSSLLKVGNIENAKPEDKALENVVKVRFLPPSDARNKESNNSDKDNNTFRPVECDTTIRSDQTIWLSPGFYNQFTNGNRNELGSM